MFLRLLSYNPYKAQYILAVLPDSFQERIPKAQSSISLHPFPVLSHTKWKRIISNLVSSIDLPDKA